MRRHLFTFGIAVSLLLFATTLAIWARSNWYEDAYTWRRRVPNTAPNQHDMVEWRLWTGGGRAWGSFYTIRLRDEKNGGLFALFEEDPPGFSHGAYAPYYGWLDDSPYGHWFNFNAHRRDNSRNIEFEFPVGLITAIAAILPLVSLLPKLRMRPPRAHCRTCGYNLTGNSSGICPECGTTVAGKAET